jgi:hypothetical protein
MRTTALTALVAAGLLVPAVPAASAATTGGTIKTCVNKRTGTLRLLHGKRCRKSERLVTWSKQGPAGTNGAAGAKGDKGDKGDPGAPATTLLLAVDNRTTTPHIVYGPPGASVQRSGSGSYVVGFGRDISHCVPAANVGGVPVGAGASAPTIFGFARVDIPGTAPSTFMGLPIGTLALVGTYGIVGGVTTAQDASFFLAMLC